MKYKIELNRKDNGLPYILTMIWPGRKGKQIKRRFKTYEAADDYGRLVQAESLIAERALEKELKKEARKDEHQTGQMLTFATELDYYESHHKDSSPGFLANVKSYRKELASFNDENLFPLASDQMDVLGTPVDEINKVWLREIEKRLVKNNPDLSVKTLNNKIGFIQSVISFSVQDERLKENPLLGYRKKKLVKPVIRFWDKSTAEDYLGFISKRYPVGSSHRWVYAVYLLVLNAGLRAGEAWALKPSCLRREQAMLYIHERIDRVERKFYPPKGKGPRLVPMPQELLVELDLIQTTRKLGRYRTYFETETGTPICHDNFSNRFFEKDLKAWGGPVVTFHELRHTCATNMLSSGVDPRTVQEVLGHKSLQTTMRYVHAIGANIQKVSGLFSLRPMESRPTLKIV